MLTWVLISGENFSKLSVSLPWCFSPACSHLTDKLSIGFQFRQKLCHHHQIGFQFQWKLEPSFTRVESILHKTLTLSSFHDVEIVTISFADQHRKRVPKNKFSVKIMLIFWSSITQAESIRSICKAQTPMHYGEVEKNGWKWSTLRAYFSAVFCRKYVKVCSMLC